MPPSKRSKPNSKGPTAPEAPPEPLQLYLGQSNALDVSDAALSLAKQRYDYMYASGAPLTDKLNQYKHKVSEADDMTAHTTLLLLFAAGGDAPLWGEREMSIVEHRVRNCRDTRQLCLSFPDPKPTPEPTGGGFTVSSVHAPTRTTGVDQKALRDILLQLCNDAIAQRVTAASAAALPMHNALHAGLDRDPGMRVFGKPIVLTLNFTRLTQLCQRVSGREHQYPRVRNLLDLFNAVDPLSVDGDTAKVVLLPYHSKMPSGRTYGRTGFEYERTGKCNAIKTLSAVARTYLLGDYYDGVDAKKAHLTLALGAHDLASAKANDGDSGSVTRNHKFGELIWLFKTDTETCMTKLQAGLDHALPIAQRAVAQKESDWKKTCFENFGDTEPTTLAQCAVLVKQATDHEHQTGKPSPNAVARNLRSADLQKIYANAALKKSNMKAKTVISAMLNSTLNSWTKSPCFAGPVGQLMRDIYELREATLEHPLVKEWDLEFHAESDPDDEQIRHRCSTGWQIMEDAALDAAAAAFESAGFKTNGMRINDELWVEKSLASAPVLCAAALANAKLAVGRSAVGIEVDFDLQPSLRKAGVGEPTENEVVAHLLSTSVKDDDASDHELAFGEDVREELHERVGNSAQYFKRFFPADQMACIWSDCMMFIGEPGKFSTETLAPAQLRDRLASASIGAGHLGGAPGLSSDDTPMWDMWRSAALVIESDEFDSFLELDGKAGDAKLPVWWKVQAFGLGIALQLLREEFGLPADTVGLAWSGGKSVHAHLFGMRCLSAKAKKRIKSLLWPTKLSAIGDFFHRPDTLQQLFNFIQTVVMPTREEGGLGVFADGGKGRQELITRMRMEGVYSASLQLDKTADTSAWFELLINCALRDYPNAYPTICEILWKACLFIPDKNLFNERHLIRMPFTLRPSGAVVVPLANVEAVALINPATMPTLASVCTSGIPEEHSVQHLVTAWEKGVAHELALLGGRTERIGTTNLPTTKHIWDVHNHALVSRIMDANKTRNDTALNVSRARVRKESNDAQTRLLVERTSAGELSESDVALLQECETRGMPPFWGWPEWARQIIFTQHWEHATRYHSVDVLIYNGFPADLLVTFLLNDRRRLADADSCHEVANELKRYANNNQRRPDIHLFYQGKQRPPMPEGAQKQLILRAADRMKNAAAGKPKARKQSKNKNRRAGGKRRR